MSCLLSVKIHWWFNSKLRLQSLWFTNFYYLNKQIYLPDAVFLVLEAKTKKVKCQCHKATLNHDRLKPIININIKIRRNHVTQGQLLKSSSVFTRGWPIEYKLTWYISVALNVISSDHESEINLEMTNFIITLQLWPNLDCDILS